MLEDELESVVSLVGSVDDTLEADVGSLEVGPEEVVDSVEVLVGFVEVELEVVGLVDDELEEVFGFEESGLEAEVGSVEVFPEVVVITSETIIVF